MAIHIFIDGVKIGFQNDPFETWLDQRMTYKQPQKDWGIHLQQRLSSITDVSPLKSFHYPPTTTSRLLAFKAF